MDNNITQNFSECARKRVTSGDLLEDSDIDFFLLLLTKCSKYKPFSTLLLYLGLISEIPRNQKHIQIIYLSSVCNNPNDTGHWVTSYYDTDYIYVFDSINNKVMHKDLEKSLKLLHPYYFLEGKRVIFPKVQQQTNQKDCGIFAIAFAITLLCKMKPDLLTYNTHIMRPHLLKLLVSKYIAHFPCIITPIPINVQPRKLYDTNIIINNACLNDEHIDYFHTMLQQLSAYQPYSTLYLQNISKISHINENNKHIQILFQRGSTIGHFVCTYYDTSTLFVYDSMNNKELHSDISIVLKTLHPYCFNEQKKPIIFQTVQSQKNATDCGVYSIAYAVTLLFGYRPETMVYNNSEMRKHLLKIFETRTIEHFPCLSTFSNYCSQFNFSSITETRATISGLGNNVMHNRKRTNDQITDETSLQNHRETNLHSLAIKKKKHTIKKIKIKFYKLEETNVE
ncbi:uncharacterized protein LOC116418298 [Nasonia vitripennis]|uniref:Ubiquitin-like protease family profile domain-containing protein n=1 Tax=Nasonia vitripennis TaxID=7425 RepID=A0A7M7R4X2_NASVI|nr:uncharacterized protein LOC116418298 [Nasonia vitripennis]XP_032458126.1 uncharacterized protein LOC116418298 [Nasonia vitripennis]